MNKVKKTNEPDFRVVARVSLPEMAEPLEGPELKAMLMERLPQSVEREPG
jgi:hypothetical protein